MFHQDLARLNKMVEYCTTAGCLRACLLDYFGEAHTGSCGNCGNCTAQYVERDITIEAQKILSAVARVEKKYSYGLGVNAITGLLRGSSAQRIKQLGLDKIPTYGALKELKQAQIQTYIDFLKEEGYLKLTGDEYPVLRLTNTAGEVLFRGKPVTFRERAARQKERKPTARRTMDAPLPAECAGLLDALKALRLQLAREEDVPAYIVFRRPVGNRPAAAPGYERISGDTRHRVCQGGPLWQPVPGRSGRLRRDVKVTVSPCASSSWEV